MNISPEYLIERKRNKLSVIRWKIVTLIVVIGAIVAFSQGFKTNLNFLQKQNPKKEPYIGSIEINDIVYGDFKKIKIMKERVLNDNDIKALIVNVDCPGGTVVGAENIFNTLRKIAEKKPVVAVLWSVAASGGYMVALGADYIVTHNGTLTGSIGVILRSTDISELAKKIGVTSNTLRSSEFKAMPDLFEKTPPYVKEVLLEGVMDTYQYFIELVATRRNLDIDYVKKIADGRTYTGRQAYSLKLVDAIGEEETALSWLYQEKKISSDLKVKIVEINKKDNISFLFDFFSKIKSSLSYISNQILFSI